MPQTIHIVGETWSGRAYELRQTFERCATPHTFCLADSAEGRDLLAKAGPGTKLPVMILPDGRVLSDPSNMEIAEAAGATNDFDQDTYDSSSLVQGRPVFPLPSMAPPRGSAFSY